MKHASEKVLQRLAPLLVEIRETSGIMERKAGIFYRGGSAFLHFHEDPSGLYADLRGKNDWIRLPVNTAADRKRLLREIRGILADG